MDEELRKRIIRAAVVWERLRASVIAAAQPEEEKAQDDVVRLLHKQIEDLEARLAKVVEAASEVAEGACSFSDPRLSYEEWQINVGSMERLRAAISAEPSGLGWLIESTLSGDSRPRWWQAKRSGTEEQWTADAGRGVRFARREDAEACRLTLAESHVTKVTEHVWL